MVQGGAVTVPKGAIRIDTRVGQQQLGGPVVALDERRLQWRPGLACAHINPGVAEQGPDHGIIAIEGGERESGLALFLLHPTA